ncbi:cyclic nucleotide-binding/CBS domain-containing protein [Labrenzia sp. VG12]|uniref:CBS domain-containing protein n=1 Tax=Labrenzia sp. VG12 TaxID=2021862 RepID=UPI0018DF4631|nr:CBS domain-containing protein [Labrenzia sp. VG12]
MITKSIGDILAGRPLFSISKDTSIREAARVMLENGVGALAVIDEGMLAGILTERDIVFRGVAKHLSMDDRTAGDIMTPDPVTVDSADAVSDALAAKLGDRFRHLPVIERDKVVGIISFRDIPAEYVMMFERFREMSAAH